MLADSAQLRSRFQGISRSIPRQVEPVPFLVGWFRSGVHAVLRTARAGLRGENSKLSRLRDEGGVLARVHKRRMVAGLGRLPGDGAVLLRLLVSRTARIRRCTGAAGRRVLSKGDARVV